MNPENENIENENVDYINAINELKANTVDKKAYEKLKAENRQLLDTLVNGGQINQVVENKVDEDELRKHLFEKPDSLSDIQYWKDTLALRKCILDKGERDIFLSCSANYTPSGDDVAEANEIADTIQGWIDMSDDDPATFKTLINKGLYRSSPF